MNHKSVTGWTLCIILICSSVLQTYTFPQMQPSQIAAQYRPVDDSNQKLAVQSHHQIENHRKFAEKPNGLKKVALDDIDEEVQTNQIQDNNGFSWTNMIGTVMQMFFNNAQMGPNKSDDLDTNGGFAPSPWANVISVGLKIITTLLGGGATNDGIDKVDNGVSGTAGSPMQGILAAVLSGVLGTRDPEQVNTMAKQAGEFFNIVVNLLDALRTSFSHRSMAARSIGKKDSISDAAVASISMLKGYVRTYRNSDDMCMKRYLCDANIECNKDIGGNSIFCQLGSYATSFFLERTTGKSFESLYDAGRRGRSGEDCRQMYIDCNEV